MAGFRDLLGLVLRWLSSETATLTSTQKTLGGTPVVTLTIGSTDLSAYVWGYRYEEKAEDPGGLTIWLDNRGGRFDDLDTNWADIVRGAAIDLRRGLPVGGVDTTEKLPRTWIEGWRYVYNDGAALFELRCIDWQERCGKFRYAEETSWDDTEVSTIASSMLGQVGLSLEAGSFSFATDFSVSPRRDLSQALTDLMRRVDEYLYAGLDGEIKHKALDPTEAASYTYGWMGPGGATLGAGEHPAMAGTEVAETSARYNKVVVVGGADKEYSGTAQDSTEIALVGTRLRTITNKALTSDDQCAEQARSELRFWQAQTVVGTIVARPHFTLRMYDVLELGAPPWGGPGVTGRVRRIVEEYGRGQGLWHQVIEIGGLAGKALVASDLSDGAVGSDQIVEGAITADEVAAGAIVSGKIAAGSVTADKISVSSLSAISADMGTLTAGTIKMGTGTKDSNLTGFQIDANELVGQNAGVDQVVLSSSDGKITAGAGAVVLSAEGIYSTSGNADVNKLKVKDGSDTILAAYAEIESEVGASGIVEARGKGATEPEGTLELVAITHDGTAHDGLASVTIVMETANGKITMTGNYINLGTTFLELAEQSDPDAPGSNRGRVYVRDNGSGKSQLCVRFNTGAVQVVATEP